MVVTTRSSRSINASTSTERATSDMKSGTPNLSKKEILSRARAKAAAWSESRTKGNPTEIQVRYEESDGEDDDLLPSSFEMKSIADAQNETSSEREQCTPISNKDRLALARAKARKWAEEKHKQDEGDGPAMKPDIPDMRNEEELFYSPEPFHKTKIYSPKEEVVKRGEEAPDPTKKIPENLLENNEPVSSLSWSPTKGVGIILIPTALLLMAVLMHLGILRWSAVQNKLDSPQWNAFLKIMKNTILG